MPDKETWYHNFFLKQNKNYSDKDVLKYQQQNIFNATSVCKPSGRSFAIDVGANIGLISIQLAYKFWKVLAIEPRPDTYECLKKNVRKYQQIETLHAAVGSSLGSIGFSGAENDCAHSQVTPEAETKVPLITLDSLNLDACDLIKIDTEGYELEVIKGALATIQKFRPVIILEELSMFRKDNASILYKQYGPDFVNLHRRPRRILEDMGYEIYSRQGHDFVLAHVPSYVSESLLPSESVVDDHPLS